jgi:hypothetical protein
MSGLFNEASLVLVPSGYKAGKVYSQVPTNGDGDLTFTRASDATRVNSDGEIEVVGSGVPRLDYSQGSCPALLLEPQRTNLIRYSEQFDNAAWALTNVNGTGLSPIVTANAGTAPDGTNTADRIVFDLDGGTTTSDISRKRQLVSFPSAGEGTLSFYVKSFDGVSSYVIALEDSNGMSGSITVTGAWTRITRTASTYPVSNIGIGLGLKGGQVIPNSDVADLLVWGAQLEVGSYATSYIPTTSATVTRLADTFTRDNIYTNGLISSSGGTWFVELRNNVEYVRDSIMRLGIGDTSDINSNSIYLFPSSNGRLIVTKAISGSTTSLFTTDADNAKLAIKWNGTTADVFQNGVKVVSATAFTTTLMEYFLNTATGVPIFIQQMALYPSPLSDSDCIQLTTL